LNFAASVLSRQKGTETKVLSAVAAVLKYAPFRKGGDEEDSQPAASHSSDSE
jgi:hypothetical protein